jgi:uncharacterized Zn-finger protein
MTMASLAALILRPVHITPRATVEMYSTPFHFHPNREPHSHPRFFFDFEDEDADKEESRKDDEEMD